jgi:ABC-type cobalt transport system substrate-binding protein
LKKEFPDYNTRAVDYRTSYLANKIAAIAQPSAAAGSSGATGGNAGGQVKLLEPGAEPRQVLRLHPQAGDKQTLEFTVKTAVETAVGEMQTPATKLPALTMNMDMTVKSVSAGGDISYEMVVNDASFADDPEVMPKVAEAMKAALAGVKGLSVTGTLSSRGFYTATSVKAPAGADAQSRRAIDTIKETISTIATPLPEPAVGVGAKWETGRKLKTQGMNIDQTTTYEVVSIEDQRVTLKGVITQRAANQKVENASMPGIKVELTKMTGAGSADLTLDLSKLVAPTAAMSDHEEMTMGMDMGGQKQTMKMKVDTSVKIEAK